MYFVMMGSEEGPAGPPEFVADRDAAADRAVAMAHSAECPVPGMVVVGESPATSMAELDALGEADVVIHGALQRVAETTVGGSQMAGWIWAAQIRYKGGFPGRTSPAPDRGVE